MEYNDGDVLMPTPSPTDLRSRVLWTMWSWSNAHAQIFLWLFSLESGQDTSLIASRMLS